MKSNITVRKAKPGDLKTVQDLNHQLFISDSRHFDDLNTNWPYEKEGEDYFRKRIAGDEGVCFVAEQDGQVVGYVAGGWSHLNFSAYKGKRAELENICVSEAARSKGVGALLVKALYRWAEDNGAQSMMVDAYAANGRAITFYQAQGFEPYANVLWRRFER